MFSVLSAASLLIELMSLLTSPPLLLLDPLTQPAFCLFGECHIMILDANHI